MKKGEQVIVHRHTLGALDAHGNATLTYTDEPLDGVTVSPRQGEEPRSTRDMVIRGLTVYMPPGATLDAHDEMTVRGTRYRVVGDAGTWTHPNTGTTWGVQAALERVEG